MTKVELFEAIRRDKHVHGKSKREIARTRGVHRRTVRQALKSASPPPRNRTEREPPILTPSMRRQIDTWLEEDQAPRKQRHTARRICQRLRAELEFAGAESTVRRYVGRRRRALGLGKAATYDTLFATLGERFEPAEAARQMLAVLMLHREVDPEAVQDGAFDGS